MLADRAYRRQPRLALRWESARTTQGVGRDDWGAFDRAIQTATQTFGTAGTAVAVVNAAG
jgi:hypothetical protein